LSFARPLRAAGGRAGRGESTTSAGHRTDGALYVDTSCCVYCFTPRFDLWLIVQEHA